MRTCRILLPVVAVLGCAAAARAAEDAPVERTDEQIEIEEFLLDEADFLLAPEGFVFESLTFTRADGGAKVSEQRTLEAGVTYAFMSKCEAEKCVGISLSLSDEMGHLYTESNQEGEDAYFGFAPEATGIFTLDIDIFTCSENPCEAGLAVYRLDGLPSIAPEP